MTVINRWIDAHFRNFVGVIEGAALSVKVVDSVVPMTFDDE